MLFGLYCTGRRLCYLATPHIIFKWNYRNYCQYAIQPEAKGEDANDGRSDFASGGSNDHSDCRYNIQKH